MSYNRDFYLTINEPGRIHEVYDYLDEHGDEYGASFYIVNRTELVVEENWREYKDELAKLSTHFPAVLFTLKVYGEEPEDITVVYALDGKTEERSAIITFPDTTFTIPTTEHRTVNVTVLGVDIPVEIECAINTSDDFAYEMAKQQLKDKII